MSDSRAEFEAWARRENLPLVPECCDKSPNGDYRFLWMQSNWLAWQASRAQPERKLTDIQFSSIAKQAGFREYSHGLFCADDGRTATCCTKELKLFASLLQPEIQEDI